MDDFGGPEYDLDTPSSENTDLDPDDLGDDKYGYWTSSQEHEEDHQQDSDPYQNYLQQFDEDEEQAIPAPEEEDVEEEEEIPASKEEAIPAPEEKEVPASEKEAVPVVAEALPPQFNELKASHIPLLIYMEDSTDHGANSRPIFDEVKDQLQDTFHIIEVDPVKYSSFADRFHADFLPCYILFKDEMHETLCTPDDAASVMGWIKSIKWI